MKALRFKQGSGARRETRARGSPSWTRSARSWKSSSRLGRLVALVLNLGNALHATRGVAAAGFSLSSLSKLLDTRSFDGSTTLLHYMVAHLEREREERSGDQQRWVPRELLTCAKVLLVAGDCPLLFAEELPSLAPASRLTFAMLDEELAPLRGGLKALEHELALATSASRRRMLEILRAEGEGPRARRRRFRAIGARRPRAPDRRRRGRRGGGGRSAWRRRRRSRRRWWSAAEVAAFRESVARFHADAKAESSASSPSRWFSKAHFAGAAAG